MTTVTVASVHMIMKVTAGELTPMVMEVVALMVATGIRGELTPMVMEALQPMATVGLKEHTRMVMEVEVLMGT
ncbi:hypothetical protein OAL67_00380 [bacterium]|nr:hypothetical protein [bacterium]